MRQKNLRKELEAFFRLCEDTAVVVYGPYPPCRGRSRWRLQVFDPASKRKKSLTAATREEAEDLKRMLEVEVRRHAPITLHAAIAQYLEYKAATTAGGWVRTLGDRLKSFLPDVPVNQIGPERAEAIYEAETRRVGKFGVVKAATHQAILRNTKEFFRWLCKKKLASSNPFEQVEPIGKPNAGKEQPRETDAQKLDALLFESARQGDEGALALLVQIYLGLRPGEVLALLVGSVEREGQKVSILRGKSRNAKRGLELYPEVGTLLWAHCKGRPETERVFAANLSQKPATNWMYKRLHRFCEMAGIKKYCPHSLRGLHSSLALEGGATTHQVAASLGHASFSTTARHYADPSVLENARSRRVVAVLKKGDEGTLERALDSMSPAERDELLRLLQKKTAA